MAIKKSRSSIWSAQTLDVVDVTACLEEFRDAGRNIKHVKGTWLAFEKK